MGYAATGDEGADAGEGAGVEACGAVGLGLQSYAHVFDGGGEDRVCEACEGAGGVVLAIGEGGGGVVAGFEEPAGIVEGAELDGDLYRGGS